MKNYFKESEFIREGEIVHEKMDKQFLKKLNLGRSYSNVKFVLNESWSSPEADKRDGTNRKSTSSHYKGIAVDIKALTSRDKFEIVTALLKAGFTRIGIGKNFIHVDNDMSKVQHVIWTY
jgi:hypothetical protein